MELSATETRILGCLLEKQRTTPDMYPLTLNGLRLACNQSTNRDPVVDYGDEEIRDGLHRLERRGFARLASGPGSRAPKYRHLLADALPMSSAEQALICTLMLRGPQTPGELKQRADRMHPFGDLEAVNDTLTALIERGLAERLERRPGQKEERYVQLLEEPARQEAGGQPPAGSPRPAGGSGEDVWEAPHGRGDDRRAEELAAAIRALELRVEVLEAELSSLRAQTAAHVPAGMGR